MGTHHFRLLHAGIMASRTAMTSEVNFPTWGVLRFWVAETVREMDQ